MKATESIRIALESSKGFLDILINDLQDEPLAQPTTRGGNYALWILGHLACSEAHMLKEIIQEESNPLESWKELFGAGSEPTANADDYPRFEEVREKFDQIRGESLAYLETITDDDLDRKNPSCPPDMQSYFGTLGNCLNMISIHSMYHTGQVADIRRALGRKPVVI